MFNELIPAGRRFDPGFRQRSREGSGYEPGRFFGGLRLAPPVDFPLLNVYMSTEGAVLTAEVPGVDPEKLDIAVHQDTVTLKGSREPDDFGPDAVMHRQERPRGPFTRSFVLPFSVDGDKVEARFHRGVLRLDLPRPESDKPHYIKVSRS